MEPKIYTIIVSYNGMAWLQKCLQSLRNSTLKTQVLVVDNNSTDGSADFVEQAFPEVKLQRSRENLGFGRGNNWAMKMALNESADYVFLLNQDAWIAPDCLHKLVEQAQQHPDYGILSPQHIRGDHECLETKFAEYASPAYGCSWFSDLALNPEKPGYDSQFVNAAAWLLPKKTMNIVGGFDPLFPHYGEDEDYVERCHFKGLKLGIVPQARIWHDSYFDWNRIKNDVNRQVIANLIVFKKVSNTQRSQFLLMTKNNFNTLTDLILFRKWSRISFFWNAYWRSAKQWNKVKKARMESVKEAAFLK